MMRLCAGPASVGWWLGGMGRLGSGRVVSSGAEGGDHRHVHPGHLAALDLDLLGRWLVVGWLDADFLGA